MSDHCKTCMPEWDDLTGITDQESFNKGLAAVALCEGCGPVQVDPEGYCLGGCWGDYFTKKPHICTYCEIENILKWAPESDHYANFLRIFGDVKKCPFHVGILRRWYRKIVAFLTKKDKESNG